MTEAIHQVQNKVIAQKRSVSRPASATRIRLGAAALAVAGLFFVLYPAIRPFSDEVSLQGAAAFGSPGWILAHILAIIGFTLLPLGLLALHASLRDTAAEPTAYWALVLSILGVGLSLPFYGGEAFGLHAIGQYALQQQNAALLGLAPIVRGGPGLVIFLSGLLLVGLSAIVGAVAIWRSGVYAKWSGIPFAVAFSLFIPQFFFTQPIRVAHGLVIMLGCLWIAIGLWQHSQHS